MRIIDLFSGAGGAAMGLHQAFPDAEIVGVDNRFQKNYPFRFVEADALSYPLEGADFVWASPPCQAYLGLGKQANKEYPDLLAPVRERLVGWGGLWIIENVVGAPLNYSAQLCGAMFGLRTYRHRRFEAPFLLLAPPHPAHVVPSGWANGRRGRQRKQHYLNGGFVTVVGNVGRYAGKAMGIDWMTGRELSQAIPPAYSRYLSQFIPRGA